MLRMLIVDDEKVIRETIRSIIDWGSLGIEVAGLCKNGLEAYDMILDEYPDIVLTDINMPGLSGLDLIRRITQAGQDTQFVILSGYGDYAFTKEAMKLGIQHYLLKPCNETEIIEVMREVKKRCAQKRLRHDQQTQDCLMLKQLHESIMHNLVMESLSPQPDYARLTHQYEQFLSFTHVEYEVCCISGVGEAEYQTCIDAFRKYHTVHAEQIPVYCVQADDVLWLAFEAYDYEYTALDTAMQHLCTGHTVYERISVACLNDLLPQIHALVTSHHCVYVGFDRKCLRHEEPVAAQTLPAENTNDCIARVITLVQENIADPELTLKSISEKILYMNVDYVSRKFLKATGCKFSVFLAHARVEKAKAMFAARAGSVNEVADAVGCGNNPQYFSQLFKKVAGMTPTEYMKSIGG